MHGQQVHFFIFFEGTVTAKDDKKDEKVETCEKEVALKQPSNVPKPTPKKKRKTNMEKSLETVYKQFKECADKDFVRYNNSFILFYVR